MSRLGKHSRAVELAATRPSAAARLPNFGAGASTSPPPPTPPAHRSIPRQQRELAGRVVTRDDADWMAAVGSWRAGLRLVAGLDISFPPHDGRGAGGSAAHAACPIAALAALDFPALRVRHLELLPLVGEHALQAPYAPGFLAFRWVGWVGVRRLGLVETFGRRHAQQ